MTKINLINMLKGLIAIVLIVMMSMNMAFSQGGLNVILANQNPDPVSPGNFVYVNVKVSNIAKNDVQSATITMVENNYFKVAQGTEIVKNLGVIPAYSGIDGSSSFVIAKYKVFVSENTPIGLNTLEFRVNSGSLAYLVQTDILVQDKNPSIKVTNFEIDTIEAGKSANLTIEIENGNSIALKNVVVDLGLGEVENKVINVMSGSNQKTISLINTGERKTITYELIVSPTAEAKPYQLPVSITFEDALDNVYTSNVIGSVRVFSQTDMSVTIDSQEIYGEGTGRVTFAVANPATSSIKGTRIEILETPDYEIIEGRFHYVGDLNPDDFQTIQSQIYLKSSQPTHIKMKLVYADSYNNQKEEIIMLPMQIYSQSQLLEFGIVSKSPIGNTTLIFLSIILIIVAYLVGRRLGYKKAKTKRQG